VVYRLLTSARRTDHGSLFSHRDDELHGKELFSRRNLRCRQYAVYQVHLCLGAGSCLRMREGSVLTVLIRHTCRRPPISWWAGPLISALVLEGRSRLTGEFIGTRDLRRLDDTD